MRYLRAITLAVMLVTWAAGPVAACCLPGSRATEPQEASCRDMGPQCGDQMQASHSCCVKSVKHDQSSLASRGDELRPELAVAQLGSQDGSWGLPAVLIPAGSFYSPSPPGPAPGATAILRI